jgi:hypothetical protein
MKDCHNVTKGSDIAKDGKTICGFYDKSSKHRAIHMLSVFLLQMKSSLVK